MKASLASTADLEVCSDSEPGVVLSHAVVLAMRSSHLADAIAVLPAATLGSGNKRLVLPLSCAAIEKLVDKSYRAEPDIDQELLRRLKYLDSRRSVPSTLVDQCRVNPTAAAANTAAAALSIGSNDTLGSRDAPGWLSEVATHHLASDLSQLRSASRGALLHHL